MAPRAAVRFLLGNDAELQSYDFTVTRIVSTMAADSLSREFRWMVLKFMDGPAAFGLTGITLMESWLYQPHELGLDYGVLDVALQRVKEVLTAAEQVAGADGWTLNGAEWESDSPDLNDEGFRALTRFARFRVSGRSVVGP